MPAVCFLLLIIIFLTSSFASADWDDNLKFKGDFRLRYQNETKEDTDYANDPRVRFRYRARLGLEVQPNENVKVKFGLATGNNDARSTNETMENSLITQKDIYLDYASAEYRIGELTFLGGKMKNPLWQADNLLWDTDINPEGLAIKYSSADFPSIFLNLSGFIIDELSTTAKDQTLTAFQIGYNSIYSSSHLKVSITKYSFQNTPTNIDAIAVDAQMGISLNNFPYFGIISQKVTNESESNNNYGFLLGIVLGNQKVNESGQWQTKILDRHLETNSWMAIGDSDAYGGAINASGTEIVYQYGLAENIILGLDYYSMDQIEGTSAIHNLFQVDLSVKF